MLRGRAMTSPFRGHSLHQGFRSFVCSSCPSCALMALPSERDGSSPAPTPLPHASRPSLIGRGNPGRQTHRLHWHASCLAADVFEHRLPVFCPLVCPGTCQPRNSEAGLQDKVWDRVVTLGGQTQASLLGLVTSGCLRQITAGQSCLTAMATLAAVVLRRWHWTAAGRPVSWPQGPPHQVPRDVGGGSPASIDPTEMET